MFLWVFTHGMAGIASSSSSSRVLDSHCEAIRHNSWSISSSKASQGSYSSSDSGGLADEVEPEQVLYPDS